MKLPLFTWPSMVSIPVKLGLCCLLVLAADLLFYHEDVGWTAGLWSLLLLVVVRASARQRRYGRSVDMLALSCLGLCVAMVESPSWLAGILFSQCIVTMAILPKLKNIDDCRTVLRKSLRYTLTGWTRLFRDSWLFARVLQQASKTPLSIRRLLQHWLLPIGVSAIFIGLFAQANPVITSFFAKADWTKALRYLSIGRVIEWLTIAAACWALIRPKLKPSKRISPSVAANPKNPMSAYLFNQRAIFSSLILFNGLFFLQNSMDVAFLWSKLASLPPGLSYAEYAHRGAYSLIATALLAGCFALTALKPGTETERMPVIRLLVMIWIGQNIFLVLSSILRLLSYIEEYSLTYLRVAALIWMGLVTLGLILIVVKIQWRRDNLWLINANGLMLFATLYTCCFIDFGAIIARHNVTHVDPNCKTSLDSSYLANSVGVSAIPALLWFEQTYPMKCNLFWVREDRMNLQRELDQSLQDWHRWTYRDHRLGRKIYESFWPR